MWHYFNVIISISKYTLFLIQQSVKRSSKEEVSVSRDKEQEGVFVELLAVFNVSWLNDQDGWMLAKFFFMYLQMEMKSRPIKM